MTTRNCVRCLCPKHVRKRAGQRRDICIIQCEECGFNATGSTFAEAEHTWNNFAVWRLVDVLSAQNRAPHR